MIGQFRDVRLLRLRGALTLPDVDTQPPVVPGHTPDWSHTLPPQPAAKPTRLPWIVAGAALCLLLVIGGIAAGRLSDQRRSPTLAPQVPRAAATTPAITTPVATTASPSVANILLTPKITHKECFGSAGCNIEFEVRLAYSGPRLSDSDTWQVTYEVHGVEDGPLIDTLDLIGSEFRASTQSATLARSSDKLTVKVTDVEHRG